MAKLSSINKNNKRIKLSNRFYKKRTALKKIIMDKKIPLEERFKAQQKLSNLPRNSAKNRVRNRCQITGRPHAMASRRALGNPSRFEDKTKRSTDW